MMIITADNRVTSWRGYEYKSETLRNYTLGKLKPNYPMPAVRLDVEIFPQRVVLWTRYDGHLDYRYLA